MALSNAVGCLDSPAVDGLEDAEEFDEAHRLTRTFCRQMSESQFEEQALTETEKAVADLMMYLDTNKEEFTEFLRKKKKQDLENGGIISFVKVKVLDLLHGENSPLVRVSDKERDRKLQKMKTNMQKALEYTIESKGKRYSKRLENKRKGQTHSDTPVRARSSSKLKGPAAPPTVPVAPPPPPPPLLPNSMPPPPPPPPVMDTTPKYGGKSLARRPLTPIGDRMNIMSTPSSIRKSDSQDLNDSLGSLPQLDCSLTSLHQELLSSNPWKRLRCVDENRSPGGTPGPAKRSLQMSGAPGVPSQPLYQALFNNIQEKFRNARSPSLSPRSSSLANVSVTSPQDFTP